MELDIYTKSEMNARLDGLTFVKCTQAEYAAIETHGASMVYWCTDSGKIYLGDTPMGSGGAAGGTVVFNLRGITSNIVGVATTGGN